MAKVVEELQVLIKQHGAKKVSAAMRGVEKQTDKTTSSLLKMAAGYVGIRTALAGVKGLNNLYQKQELAEKRLESTTKRLGDATGKFAASLKAEASAFQLVSTYGDEAIMQTQALLLNMGATEENISKATQAALDMSSALGKDLQSATQQLGKTFGGFAGELGELIPELKDLTAEELRQGKAVDLLLEKYGGAAKDDTKTLYGAMSQAKNAVGDLGEKAFAPLAPLVRDAASAISEMATQLNKAGEPMELFSMLTESMNPIMSNAAKQVAIAQRQIAALRKEAQALAAITPESSAAEADRLYREAHPELFGVGLVAPPSETPKQKAAREKARRARAAKAKETGFEGFGFGTGLGVQGVVNEAAALEAEAEAERKRNAMIQESIDKRLEMEGARARKTAELDQWVADQAIEQQKRVTEAGERNWQKWADGLASNASQVAMSFGEFFAGVSNDGESAGEHLKRALLGQIGDLAISHGVIAMKTAFAEAYQTSGLSLVAVAPAALLIAAGVALKAGQVPSSSSGGASGGGAASFGPRMTDFRGGAAAGDNRSYSTTINITGFIGNDPMGAAKEVSRIVTDAQREAG